MMKRLLLPALLLSLAGSMAAQDASPVVVVSAQGKVQYTSATTTTPVKIAPGALLKSGGTLKMPAKSSVLLYRDGQFQRIEGKGTKSLSTVFTDQGNTRSLNFDNEFGSSIDMSVSLVAAKQKSGQSGDGWGDVKKPGDGWGDVKKPGDGWGDVKKPGDGWGDTKKPGDGWGDVKKPGDGWGDVKKPGDGWGDNKKPGDGWGDDKKPGDGWGGKGFYILPILPNGYVRPGNVTFSWSKPARANSYELKIRSADKGVVFATTVTDTFAVVDLGKLNLTADEDYVWRVTVPADTVYRSAFGEFTIGEESGYADAVKKASNSKIYKTATPATQRLMEAVALEKAAWYYDAHLVYAALLKANPKDDLARMNYAAFWMRGGLNQMAKAVMSH